MAGTVLAFFHTMLLLYCVLTEVTCSSNTIGSVADSQRSRRQK